MHGTYEFRKELLEIHRPNTRNYNYVPTENTICVDDTWHIEIAADCGIVIQTAAEDLQDYMRTSLGVCVALKSEKSVKKVGKTIVVATAGQLGCVEAEGQVLGPARIISTCFAMGEAAGTAAAHKLDEAKSFKCIDVQALRADLRNHGAEIDGPFLRWKSWQAVTASVECKDNLWPL